MPTPLPQERRLPLYPILVVALAVAAQLAVRYLTEIERNLVGIIAAAIDLLAFALLLAWFLTTRRFRPRTRLAGLAALLVLGLALALSLRVDGVADGTGRPRLVWKWTPPRPSLAPAIVPEPPSGTGTPRNPAAGPADPRLAQATDVPQFFGPHRTGVVTGAGLDPDWSTHPPRQLWRQPVGAGWSAFAVVQGRAYTQEQRGEDELVLARDLFTGQLLWVHADRARFTQWQGGEGPRATPTVEGGRVFTYGATGLLNCLNATNGAPLWQRAVLAENHLSNLEWGVSASPLVDGDRVIITGGSGGPALFAYHRDTGTPLWQAGQDQASYASPVSATLAGRRVILDSNARGLVAHNPTNGTVLLKFPWGNGNWPRASQPVVLDGDRVFLAAGYGMGCRLLHVQAAPDGTLSASELWHGISMKTQFNSVAVRDGHLYGLDDGLLACVDVATGRRRWKDGRFGSGQTLLVDDLVLIQGETGPVVLAAATPEGYRELASLPALEGKTWNHPTLAGRYLLVRNDHEAACYELPLLGGTSSRESLRGGTSSRESPSPESPSPESPSPVR